MNPVDIAYQQYFDSQLLKMNSNKLSKEQFVESICIDDTFNEIWGKGLTNELEFSDRLAIYKQRGWNIKEINYADYDKTIEILNKRAIPKRELK
jgi:hypothetical protein